MSTDTRADLPLASLPLTDAGNAERLILMHGERIRYVRAWRAWRTFDGRTWVDGSERVMRLMRETMRATYAQGVVMLDEGKSLEPEERKALAAKATAVVKWSANSESTPSLKRAIEQAASFEALEADPRLFQPRPWVVPFPNGVWDHGEWRPHRPGDYFETLLPVDHNPDADRSDLEELLGRMTGDDADLARTLQDVAGYALSGASSMRTLFWLYGPAGTGKSTFVELLRAALGETAAVLDRKLVRDDAEDEAIGRAVRAKRVVILSEMGGKRVSAEIVKGLSGGDPWPCRYLYSNTTHDVDPTWAVVAVGNDAPTMAAHDEALRDRLLALPFEHPLGEGGALSFTGGARIEEYRRRTDTPLMAGFVAWMVEGLARVLSSGEIHQADAALAHTRTFWEDTDPLTPFWIQPELRRELGTEEGVAAAALHGAYLTWCDQERIGRPLRGKPWGAACRAAGLEQKIRNTGAFWRFPQEASGGFGGGVVDSGVFSRKPPLRVNLKEEVTKRCFSTTPPPNPPLPGVRRGVL